MLPMQRQLPMKLSRHVLPDLINDWREYVGIEPTTDFI